jgi:hypothetical protein
MREERFQRGSGKVIDKSVLRFDETARPVTPPSLMGS